ncbi:NAD(P)-dependent dehydrogenase (short-subunit alcohol dehydrogenase family) [Crossiella equi]|uniref:NAD(P)-dependent dehydrogenase (Short-subunit alcohol dehydrogenase family) n=1 Tax=Crossiella equi TaxID=130796 RepID=A0ABS5A7I7_9PSEU|nr:SDR family NAD(P)-dependent oxidoreductase [Crossiella equi]MBP2472560.1 NAD(P)-dependent dehydrogenase (short-subunit alcohol dehydrogenase family) [Crossiella equi]
MRTLITGATSGHGLHLARSLAEAGHRVLVHGRTEDRAAEVAARLPGAVPVHADLASRAGVRSLAAQVGECPLDVLVLNAGIGYGTPEARHVRELSPDGHELRFAVNYLAPVLLTRLLLPNLRAAAPSRVVAVGSAGQSPLDLTDPAFTRCYDGLEAYRRSKLALAMFTFDLAAELRGTGVTANVVHPATYMDTRMVRQGGGTPQSTVEEGAAATQVLVTDPGLAGVSGGFFTGQHRARAHEDAYRPELRARLRELTESLLARD